jgi:GNAT superfamily N-acetyltransferase
MESNAGQSDKSINVRDVAADDAPRWAELFAAYREFYEMPADDTVVATTWDWILRREHTMRGIVAVAPDGRMVGLANLRFFARPSTATIGLYLDDLFTDPEARGLGVATALIDHAAHIAHNNGASVVRWITATTNTTARRIYDANATATAWVTYDMVPRSS